MKSIKIGRKEYEIKKGDYVLFNGACHQFCSGDGRVLKYEGYSKYTSLVIPKTTVNKIPLENMQKDVIKRNGVYFTCWYF